MTPQEFDGNSVMKTNTSNWSPFYHADNANYPLLNRMLAVPSMRQRYLAHLRTLINEKMQSTSFNALLESYRTLIDAEVQADPKKLYSYAAFNSELTVLQNYITNRRNYLLGNTEVAQLAPVITAVAHRANGVEWADPLPSESVTVTATMANPANMARVDLFHCLGAYGKFTSVQMFDDGAHGDGASGDGVYGATIPQAASMTRVRYYVKATANNTAQSVSFAPVGAEHDVYTYLVQVEFATTPQIRINELMAQNVNGQQDENGDHADWIELYNTGSTAVDLGDGWLSDDGNNVYKWRIPTGTVIDAGAYLIIWADEEAAQGPMHASFKLSGSGEEVWLSAPDGLVLDHLSYPTQTADVAWARIPNGTGPFVAQAATFAANNEVPTALSAIDGQRRHVYPNPARDRLFVGNDRPTPVVVRDALQRVIWSGTLFPAEGLDVSAWANGTYYLAMDRSMTPVVVMH